MDSISDLGKAILRTLRWYGRSYFQCKKKTLYGLQEKTGKKFTNLKNASRNLGFGKKKYY